MSRIRTDPMTAPTTPARIEVPRDFLRRLVEISLERDPDVVACEECGAPVFPDDERSTVAEVTGCWFAATRREQDRPKWCLERQAIMKALAEKDPTP